MDIDYDTLTALKRPDLQALAKKHNIKANLKSEELIEQLQAFIENDPAPTLSPTRLKRSASDNAARKTRSIQFPRSTTQPSLVTHMRTSRTVSVVIPKRNFSTRRTMAEVIKVDDEDDTEEQVDEAVEEESDANLSSSKENISEGQAIPNTNPESRPSRKAKESQKRLGVGRPVAAGGTGARRSTAKPNLYTPNKRQVVEVVLPRRMKAERIEANLRANQPASISNADQADTTARYSELEATISDLQKELERVDQAHTHQIATLKATVDQLVTRVLVLETDREKANGSLETVEELLTQDTSSNGTKGKAREVTPQVELAAEEDEMISAPTAGVEIDLASDSELIAIDPVEDPIIPPAPTTRKRLREGDSTSSPTSTPLAASPRKKARLNGRSVLATEADSPHADEAGRQASPRRGAKRGAKSASIPPTFGSSSRPVVNRSTRPTPGLPPILDEAETQATIRSSSHPLTGDSGSQSFQAATGSAIQSENQGRVGTVRATAASATRTSLRTIAKRESMAGSSSLSGTGRTRSGKGKEKPFEVGRFSIGGSALSPPSAASARKSPTPQSSSPRAQPSGSTAGRDILAQASPSGITDTLDPSPVEKPSDPSSSDEAVLELRPLTLFDTGKEFMGTPKQKYPTEWHQGIVLDDPYDNETAETIRRVNALSSEDLRRFGGGRGGSAMGDGEGGALEPVPASPPGILEGDGDGGSLDGVVTGGEELSEMMMHVDSSLLWEQYPQEHPEQHHEF